MKVVKIILGSFLFLTLPALSVLLPTTYAQTAKSVELAFDNLNDFVTKGLPAPAPLPTENLDLAAVMMAQKISKGDEQSLPVLLTALQTAGFTVIDENGKVLLKPADGKGQGLGFYDFEAVGSLKLAKSGITVSLEKIAGTITKDTPDITASQFAESLLKDLRAQANNSDNPYLRFHSRLIIELGKASAKPIDLLTAPASSATLSMLQASLLTRRLQGDIYTLKTILKQIGMSQPPFSQRNIFISASWTRDDFSFSIPVSRFAINNSPCNLSGDDALIMDASAIGLTTGNGAWVGLLGPTEDAAGKMTKLGKLSKGLAIANIVLAWGKLVAALTMLKGKIIVAEPLPLVRTKNSVPGDKRMMTARIWSEVGKPELLNCLRPAINIATGLDFNLPTDGPVGDTFIEWQFEGENTTNLDSKKFVFFETMPGTDPKPNKQLTDDKGISKMHLVGYPQKPVVGPKAIKVQKKADVLVAVTLKSSKDFVQNWLDLGGTIIGVATGGPLGLIGAAAEIGYRLPYVAARATIPVIDHEPCDGQWQGTITYTYITTSKSKMIQSKGPGYQKTRYGDGTDGAYGNSDSTTTISGTVVVNGNKQLVNSSADEIFVDDVFAFGTAVCSMRGVPYGQPPPLTAVNNRNSKLRYGGGSAQEEVKVAGISLYKDNYRISIDPRAVNGTLHSTTQFSEISCPPTGSSSTSNTNSFKSQWAAPLRDAIANYGEDRNILSGSFTKTTPHALGLPRKEGPYEIWINTITGSGTTVSTITWNLRRCS